MRVFNNHPSTGLVDVDEVLSRVGFPCVSHCHNTQDKMKKSLKRQGEEFAKKLQAMQNTCLQLEGKLLEVLSTPKSSPRSPDVDRGNSSQEIRQLRFAVCVFLAPGLVVLGSVWIAFSQTECTGW